MGSIKSIRARQLPKRSGVALFFVCFAFASFPLLGQTGPVAVSLAAEVFRLETLASAPASSAQDRHGAFLALARLHRLSGNHTGVLAAYERALGVFPGDGRTLLAKGRFFVSVGEYDKADAAISALLGGERDRELLIEGRYLGATLHALRSGNTRHLAGLAEDPDFAAHRSGIYYTLWRLTGLALYRTRLVTQFPQSPEAKIALGSVHFAATPLWLLFPGRDSIVLAAPVAAPAIPAVAVPAAPTTTAPAVAAPAPAEPPGRFLQAGLFSREENARGLAQRIERAGFQPHIVRRQVDGQDRWAVGVNGGSDANAMIRRLREAGFETFPVDISR